MKVFDWLSRNGSALFYRICLCIGIKNKDCIIRVHVLGLLPVTVGKHSGFKKGKITYSFSQRYGQDFRYDLLMHQSIPASFWTYLHCNERCSQAKLSVKSVSVLIIVAVLDFIFVLLRGK